MKRKRARNFFDMEAVAGLIGFLMVLFALAAVMDVENISVYFIGIIGMGSVLNGVLAMIQLRKRSIVLGCLLAVLSAALLFLFTILALLLKG